MSWLKLESKVAVVTGAAGGIGAAIALELARNGANVAVVDLNLEGAAQTAAEVGAIGVDAVAARVDTTDTETITAALDLVVSRWGTVDILVNNAATSVPKSLRDVSEAEWRRVLDVNLTGYLLCSQVFGKPMCDKGSGSLIHIASVAGRNPQTDSSSYSASKAGVLMLSRTLAVEWGPFGVRSNTVSPGMTRTPLTEPIYLKPGVLEFRSQLSPLGRIASTQDIADACAWIASDRAAYVTGQDVAIDGGLSQTLMTHARALPSSQ